MSDAAAVVAEFWRLMATNDFDATAAVLAPGFELEWPQSGERIRGAERFARMNREYAAHGPWTFGVRRVVVGAGDGEAVSVVDIGDGVQKATALSFFTIESGLITRLVEYWPEPFAPVAARAHLVEAAAPRSADAGVGHR